MGALERLPTRPPVPVPLAAYLGRRQKIDALISDQPLYSALAHSINSALFYGERGRVLDLLTLLRFFKGVS